MNSRSEVRVSFAGALACLVLTACTGASPTPNGPTLVIEPDDGRAPMLSAIAGATGGVRLTIYAITDLEEVVQSPAAPAASVVQALMDKARAGVPVRVIVDQGQYSQGGNAAHIQHAVAALRDAGVSVKDSSTAFCYTHQKTLLIDGPSGADAGASGTAIVMSLNLMPGYFATTRDYAVITSEPAVVSEISRVFDADFTLTSPASACRAVHAPASVKPPPTESDTPSVSEPSLLWSPVSSRPKLLELIGGATTSLVLTTEELTDAQMTCAIKAVAESASKPSVRLLLATDGSGSAASVTTLLGLGLSNLSIRVMPGQPTTPDAGTPSTPLYMHGKQVIVDGARAFLGSENLTNTSLNQNRELGLQFTDQAMVARLQAVFERDFGTAGASLPAHACDAGSCTPVTCP